VKGSNNLKGKKKSRLNGLFIISNKDDTPPNSSRNPKVNPKTNHRKKNRVGACSLTHNTSGVGKHLGALGWVHDKLTSESSS